MTKKVTIRPITKRNTISWRLASAEHHNKIVAVELRKLRKMLRK